MTQQPDPVAVRILQDRLAAAATAAERARALLEGVTTRLAPVSTQVSGVVGQSAQRIDVLLTGASDRAMGDLRNAVASLAQAAATARSMPVRPPGADPYRRF